MASIFGLLRAPAKIFSPTLSWLQLLLTIVDPPSPKKQKTKKQKQKTKQKQIKQQKKNLLKHYVFKKKTTLDCGIRILDKLFLNLQEDVLETFEI